MSEGILRTGQGPKEVNGRKIEWMGSLGLTLGHQDSTIPVQILEINCIF